MFFLTNQITERVKEMGIMPNWDAQMKLETSREMYRVDVKGAMLSIRYSHHSLESDMGNVVIEVGNQFVKK